MGPQVFRRQFVTILGAGFQVPQQFMSAEARAFLNTYSMCPKKRQVHGDNVLAGRFALCDFVQKVRTSVLSFLETQIKKFHPPLPSTAAGLIHTHMTYNDRPVSACEVQCISSLGCTLPQY